MPCSAILFGMMLTVMRCHRQTCPACFSSATVKWLLRNGTLYHLLCIIGNWRHQRRILTYECGTISPYSLPCSPAGTACNDIRAHFLIVPYTSMLMVMVLRQAFINRRGREHKWYWPFALSRPCLFIGRCRPALYRR